MAKIEELDLYELLEIDISASDTEIRKAYRKKALKCHPDKNPNDKKAGETFHKLSRALEILTDEAARAAYDKVLRAKEAAKLRHKQLDSKRQKLKEDLERRESKAAGSNFNLTDEQKLAAEIQRLQKEGSKLLQEEQQRMKEEIQRTFGNLNTPVWDPSLNRIKITWKADKNNDLTNGGYNEENLKKFLKKYGEINVLIISPKKKGSALVEFSSKEASEMAVEFEKGLPENPLKLKWINDRPILTTKKAKDVSTLVSERDYESIVLTKLRQAAERQRLIEEMMKEDQS